MHYSENLIKINIFSFKKIHLKIWYGKFWLGLSVLSYGLVWQDILYNVEG